MMGNLIYMAELGRYDLRGLMRWIGRFAPLRPDPSGRVADATPPDGLASPEARRFVNEVLRIERSERLMRGVLRDVELEGILIPRGALLRLCMWENDEDSGTFPGRRSSSTRTASTARCRRWRRSLPSVSTIIAAPTPTSRWSSGRRFSRRSRAASSLLAGRGPCHEQPAPGVSIVLSSRGRGAP